MDTKPFKTIDQQIDILKSRNLNFRDEISARRILSTIGYYELINGYKDIGLESEERYKDGFTFEQIFHLFQMDKAIRTSVNSAILEIEAHLRAVLAHTIAKHYTADQNNYLNHRNYEKGSGHLEQSQRSKLLNKCHRILEDDSHPYKHYREKHNNIPPWILVKGMTFGNLIMWYRLQKSPIKTEIISQMTGLSPEDITDETKNLISNILRYLLAYRNRCAHLGRVYNFETGKNKMHYYKSFHDRMNISKTDYKKGHGQNGLIALLHALSWFTTASEVSPVVTMLNYQLTVAIDNYLNNYPEDKNFIHTQIGGELFKIV